MVRHRHELGEGGVDEDGIVGQADVHDVEIDQLSAVVGLRAKGDCEPHLSQRGSESLCHPREGPGGCCGATFRVTHGGGTWVTPSPTALWRGPKEGPRRTTCGPR